MAVSLPTTKRLFAHSRNECAFEGCTRKLVGDDGVVVGRICHIKAARKYGPRYDKEQPATERDGFGNLILMCSEHHDVIDKNAASWSVDRLVALKFAHEAGGEIQRDDADRIAAQLIESQTIYEQGIKIGTVNAQSVQFIQGDQVHHHPGESVTHGLAKLLDPRRQEVAEQISLRVHIVTNMANRLDDLVARGPRGRQTSKIIDRVERTIADLKGENGKLKVLLETSPTLGESEIKIPLTFCKLVSLFIAETENAYNTFGTVEALLKIANLQGEMTKLIPEVRDLCRRLCGLDIYLQGRAQKDK